MSQQFRLGLFVIAGLALLATGIFLIGTQESLFTSTYTVNTEFKNVGGLNDGGEVRVGGIPEGTVKNIHLPQRPDEKVVVVMELKKQTQRILKQDSVAAIRSEGLLGDKFVEISFGSDNAQPLKNGDTIPSQPPLDISDLMDKTNHILDTTQDALHGIDTTSNNLASITTKINSGQGTIGALINDRSIYREAKNATSSLDDDMEALKHNFLLRGFFKNRGYEDTDELTKYAIPSLPAETPVQKFTYEGRQIFAKPDTAKLKNTKRFTAAGEFLQNGKFGLAVITASMGMKGEAQKQMILSEARASEVRDYLVDHFRIDDSKLKTKGLGKTEEGGEDGRVEILIYPASSHESAARNP
jgi:phospholipid/cholesterol/gamma-HCH transport system substrate-binding protein